MGFRDLLHLYIISLSKYRWCLIWAIILAANNFSRPFHGSIIKDNVVFVLEYIRVYVAH